MVKTPEFDDREVFGASGEGRPLRPPQSITVAEGMRVQLRYKGKRAFVRVTKVLKAQALFRGVVQHFDQMTLEHEGLKYGDAVEFSYEKIEHLE